jgi:hypothetical protein
MPVTRYRSGSVTFTLSGDLEGFVRQKLDAILMGSLATMEKAAQEVADEASAKWYGAEGVTKRTGQSGNIGVVTTIDEVKGEVRVGIGSMDPRKAGKTGKPLPVYVHRPWNTTLRPKEVTEPEWFAAKERGLPALPPPGHPWWRGTTNGKPNAEGLDPTRWYIRVVTSGGNQVANGKGYLLVDLVRKPARAKLKSIAPEIQKAVAARLQRGG